MQENHWSEEYDTFCVGIAREERGEQGSREYGSRGERRGSGWMREREREGGEREREIEKREGGEWRVE